jgi:hypothetical protein
VKKYVLAVGLALLVLGGYASVAAASATTGTGYFEVCKLADNSAGTVTGSFTFTWAGGSVAVPVGSCSQLQQAPAGNLTITETARTGFAVSQVSANPSGRLVNTDLNARSATIQVVAGDASTQTVVSFTNKVVTPPTGFIEICKVAGDNNVTGDFKFSVNGSQSLVTVPAGSCSTPIEVPAGTATIQELARTGFSLASLSTVPSGRLVSSNLATRTATVTVMQGSVATQTVVSFTNVTQNGQLKICKAADPNSATPVTGTFTFTLSPASANGASSVTVPVGSCSLVQSYQVGTHVTVTEAANGGYAVSAITIAGSSTIGSSSLADRKATVTIAAGTSDLTFTNKGPQGPGQIKICKLADPNSPSPVTGTFTFQLSPAGTNPITHESMSSVTVPVGSCSQPVSYPQGTSVIVTEASNDGYTVTAINTNPASGGSTIASSNLAHRTVTLTIGAGITDVTFVNKGPASICNYTKGYYRNHPAAVSAIIGAGGVLALAHSITLAMSGTTTTTSMLTTAQVTAILQATPSQLSAESGGSLNLLQQSLTALLNVERGADASAAINAAISEALASLTVTFDANGNLVAVNSTSSNIGGLTTTLSGFNESNHCS